MDPDDYFGHIPIPSDEGDEDAANDLTFGDTSDIKAGDDSSDAVWNSTHQSLASKIEAEKNLINRSRTESTSDNLPPASTWHPSPLTSTSPLHQPNSVNPSHPFLQQSPHHPQNISDHLRNNPNLSSPASVSVHPLAATPHSIPSHPQYPAQPSPPLAQDDYIRSLITFEETRAKTSLQAHENQVSDQLQKALVAQQAGVSFDRGKFDEHQNAVRQGIIRDHYVRLQQIRVLAWHRQQQQQQLIQQQQAQSIQQSAVTQQSTVTSPLIQAQRTQNGLLTNVNKDMQEFATSITENNDREMNQMKSDVNGRLEQTKIATNEAIDKAPARLLEIERQMAEAGLGPRRKKSTRENMAQFALTDRQNGDISQNQKQRSRERRLESMTDKDQELVFRVHLRQIESSILYKDDYYNTVKRSKERLSGEDMFHSMAVKVRDLRERTRQSGRELKPFRGRRLKKTAANGMHSSTSPPHSDQNMKALANSLGIVQSWNPRAPRRVMDYGKGGQQRTLRDDERIFVKLEIERGYDIIAGIHDIVRGESYDSLESQMRMLKSTLDLDGKSEHSSFLPDEGSRHRVFGMMCSQVKGRLYLMRVIDLLDSIERIQLLPALFENLRILFSNPKGSRNSDESVIAQLLNVTMTTFYDSELHAVDCISVIDAFYMTHGMNTGMLVNILRNARACKLVFTCAQRISRGLQKDEIVEEELMNTKIEQFAETLVNSLQQLFKASESKERVWELIASVDSLITSKRQETYRSELGYLLDQEAIPKPPTQ